MWVLSAPVVEAATFCLEQEAFLEAIWNRVERGYPRVIAGLNWFGYDPRPADSVLVLLRVDDVDCALRETRQRGFTARDVRDYQGLDPYARISVRRPDENGRLLSALVEAS